MMGRPEPWVKVRHGILKSPKVHKVAKATGMDEAQTIGVMLEYFVLVATQANDDGVIPGDTDYLESSLGMDGRDFAQALVDIGWIEVNSEGNVRAIDFDKHLSPKARQRAMANVRKQRQRKRDVGLVDSDQKDAGERREDNNGVEPPEDIPPDLQFVREQLSLLHPSIRAKLLLDTITHVPADERGNLPSGTAQWHDSEYLIRRMWQQYLFAPEGYSIGASAPERLLHSGSDPWRPNLSEKQQSEFPV